MLGSERPPNYRRGHINQNYLIMTIKELNRVAYAIHTTKKKKGANKGYKYTYESVWSGAMTRREYLNRLEEIDAKECGLFLCRLEQTEFQDDRWWDMPTYRDEAIKSYRGRIKAIRLRYGLSQSEVSEFMRVA